VLGAEDQLMKAALRVGIVGASVKRGWGKVSHIPAVQTLSGLELSAVATSNQASADEAARAFGAARGYGDALALTRDPGVDLVAVTVKVPDHRALVLSALTAGKHVYCEWPLGRDLTEAQELAEAALSAGVHVAIGVQARANPALLRARAMLEEGVIGRVLDAHIYSGTVAFGSKIGLADTYLEDPVNGATHLSIHGGHALDAAVAVLGGFTDISAIGSIQFPEVELDGAGRTLRRTIPDYVLTQSHLKAGGALSVAVAGGRSDSDPNKSSFRFEVVGERGTLLLEGAAPRGFQSGRLVLSLNGQRQDIGEGELAALADSACNVGGLYALLRDDIAGGTRRAPDFTHAVQLTRLIRAAAQDITSGPRVHADGWPPI
jgi:predicted dehydrogenase